MNVLRVAILWSRKRHVIGTISKATTVRKKQEEIGLEKGQE